MISKKTDLKAAKKIKSKKKSSPDLDFHERKWFKLLCLFTFFGWLIYISSPTFQINSKELYKIKATVSEKWKSGGSRNNVKLYFKTKEYSNRFGIHVGGTFGRWTEITENLHPHKNITIKIHKQNSAKLNDPEAVVPIYYLETDDLILFDENQFNEGEKSSDNRFRLFISIVFIIALLGILKD